VVAAVPPVAVNTTFFPGVPAVVGVVETADLAEESNFSAGIHFGPS